MENVKNLNDCTLFLFKLNKILKAVCTKYINNIPTFIVPFAIMHILITVVDVCSLPVSLLGISYSNKGSHISE